MSKDLVDRIRKNSTIKETDTLEKSKLFNDKQLVSTPVPGINAILSGSINGGFGSGVTMFAGPSKHFKTAFALLMAKSYMDLYPESAILFYDSEFGSPRSYFSAFNMDLSRIIHTPITSVEELKIDISNQLKSIERGQKIMILIDSVGNLASMKEVTDAEDGKTTADMTRAKQLKSLFRIITPKLTLKDIPLVAINHTYKTLELYSKDVVGGGTGAYYSGDNIYIIGRQQEKDKKENEVVGYNFIIKVEKSRYVKEGRKMPITVTYKGGISKWSGLLDIALDAGFVVKPKQGWYQAIDIETGELIGKSFREAATNNAQFWSPILNNPKFDEYIRTTYQLSHSEMVQEDTLEEMYNDVDNDDEE